MSLRDALYSLAVIAAAGCALILPFNALAQTARQSSVLPTCVGQALLAGQVRAGANRTDDRECCSNSPRSVSRPC